MNEREERWALKYRRMAVQMTLEYTSHLMFTQCPLQISTNYHHSCHCSVLCRAALWRGSQLSQNFSLKKRVSLR